MPALPRSFYNRDAVQVARALLGQRLVRIENGNRLAGVILETEAYQGEEDLGCHAHAGRTPRTAVMYGPPGQTYIYFTYGMHWCFNVVVMAEGFPAAVLIRAVQPVEGLAQMAFHRPNLANTPHWTDGPAKLTQAFGLDKQQNGVDLTESNGELFIETGDGPDESRIISGPRVGLFSVPEPWKSIPWRFQFMS